MSVLVTGTLGFDYIMDFPGRFSDRIMPEKIHKISLSFFVDKLSREFGGTAGNIAYSLSLLGITPFVLASAGKDFSPYKKFLESKNISTKNIFINKKLLTGSYFVVTDQTDNQIGSFYQGAAKKNKSLSIKQIASNNQVDIAVIAPNDPAAMRKYIKECLEINLPYLFDPAFQIDDFSTSELKREISGAKIFIGNDYEIGLVQKKLKVPHRDLLEMVPILITTLGNKGSVIETSKRKINIEPAKPKNTSDPTGAGDAYRAGFLAGFLQGLPLQTCGQMGSVAAVYTVEKYGTMTHKYSVVEFARRYKENFHEELRY